ncbi:MAG: hypothetical protein ACK5MN_05440 [Lachnospiraceae bacterium]
MTYEAVYEDFDLCSGNQEKDTTIEEITTDDLDKFVRDKFPVKNTTIEKTVREDGTIVFDIQELNRKKRYSFSEI